ncbi:MAG: prepilin peptidase [Acidobacteria bacterium]|jgi:leader peptidase (prepilin peptidase)/N-methyltransferase|nr:prepilin peptidase [Acidobacteriota bacterium]
MEEALTAGTIGLGLIVGSFLNVVIHRLPLKQDIVFRPSHCPRCQTAIPFYLNVPLLSYLVLLGRCRSCRAPISPRYPLVEGLTAFSFWLAVDVYGLSLHAGAAAVFLSLLIALAAIDLQHMILPDELTLGGSALFFIYSFFHPEIGPLQAVLSGAGAALFFAALFYAYLKLRQTEGLGFGDVKMVLLLGLFLGARRLTAAIFLASFSGLIVGLAIIVLKRKNLKLALPFGPFLALGAYAALFWGDGLLDWIGALWGRP